MRQPIASRVASAVRRARPMLFVLAVALSATVMHVQSATTSTKPEDVGLSSQRLRRVNELVQRYMDAKDITGAVTMVARHGKVAHFEAQGLMDVEAGTAMRKDAIFRMASMTKPVTGVAILMLMEQGDLRLTDPVSRFIPAFKNVPVAIPKPGRGRGPVAPGQPPPPPEIYTVPAVREITIRDLLTHVSGLESGGVGMSEAMKSWPRRTPSTLATYVPMLAEGPLDFQPGAQWRYSTLAGMETLAHIVEIVSKQPFDRFLQERIFTPLGMHDTSFVVPREKLSRVVTLYARRPNGLERLGTPEWLETTTFFSGGGGLYSTAEDYMQFAEMLVSGGAWNGVRLLSPRTIDLMAANHVGDLYEQDRSLGAPGMGFGLSVEVVVDPIRANTRRSAGSFGWGGAFGTHFWVDRKEQLVGLLMIQEPIFAMRPDFEAAVMQAVVE